MMCQPLLCQVTNLTKLLKLNFQLLINRIHLNASTCFKISHTYIRSSSYSNYTILLIFTKVSFLSLISYLRNPVFSTKTLNLLFICL